MSVEPGIFATFEMAPLEVLAFRVAPYSTGLCSDVPRHILHFRLLASKVCSKLWHLAHPVDSSNGS